MTLVWKAMAKGMMGKFFDKLSTLLKKSIQLYNDEVRLTYKDEERDMERFESDKC
jgi:hypothetical protein